MFSVSMPYVRPVDTALQLLDPVQRETARHTTAQQKCGAPLGVDSPRAAAQSARMTQPQSVSIATAKPGRGTDCDRETG